MKPKFHIQVSIVAHWSVLCCFIVYIFFLQKDEEGEHTYCGGSLISQRYVLTSAFCIVEFRHGFNQDFGQNSVRMYMGSLDCYGTGGLKRRPAKVCIVPEEQIM